MPNVKFRYSAASNISFKGTVDSGIDWEDWKEMKGREQEEVEGSVLRNLIDLEQIDEENS